MKNGLVGYFGASVVHGNIGRRIKLNQRPIVPLLELAVELAPQGSRRCRRCAAVHGQYVCVASPAVRNEWRHSDTGVELIVHLLTCQSGGPRLQAMILVNKGSRWHARAVYSCELWTTELQDGPWPLNLISETSDCGFVFPGQVEISSNNKPATPKEGVLFGNGR